MAPFSGKPLPFTAKIIPKLGITMSFGKMAIASLKSASIFQNDY
ncbi:MAG: hypothetical protein V7K26_33580 [Nostoc sp.]